MPFTIPRLDQFSAKLRARILAGVKAAKEAAWEFGEEVMADSRENYVPIDTGDLKGSGHVQTQDQPDRFTVVLGYGNAAVGYAVHVHENLNMSPVGTVIPNRFGSGTHKRIGGPKYLEKPFRKAAPQFAGRIKAAAQAALKQGT